jgi:hypothetical protein
MNRLEFSQDVPVCRKPYQPQYLRIRHQRGGVRSRAAPLQLGRRSLPARSTEAAARSLLDRNETLYFAVTQYVNFVLFKNCTSKRTVML